MNTTTKYRKIKMRRSALILKTRSNVIYFYTEILFYLLWNLEKRFLLKNNTPSRLEHKRLKWEITCLLSDSITPPKRLSFFILIKDLLKTNFKQNTALVFFIYFLVSPLNVSNYKYNLKNPPHPIEFFKMLNTLPEYFDDYDSWIKLCFGFTKTTTHWLWYEIYSWDKNDFNEVLNILENYKQNKDAQEYRRFELLATLFLIYFDWRSFNSDKIQPTHYSIILKVFSISEFLRTQKYINI